MRSLLVLVLLVALGAGGFMSKPDEAAHKANANKALAEERKGGDVLGSFIDFLDDTNREDAYEDLLVATKYTAKTKDNKVLLECWGAFTQFMCSKPGEEKK